jgi:hypothetical protein
MKILQSEQASPLSFVAFTENVEPSNSRRDIKLILDENSLEIIVYSGKLDDSIISEFFSQVMLAGGKVIILS